MPVVAVDRLQGSGAQRCTSLVSTARNMANIEVGYSRKGISELLEIEQNLNRLDPGIERDAQINLLKYLQVNEIKYYERIADCLYFEEVLKNGLDNLRTICEHEPVGGELTQPREKGSIKDYLHDAVLATECLEKMLEEVEATAQGDHLLRVISPGVKSLESTTRKANKWGGIQLLTDMARSSVVCCTTDGLACVFRLLNERLQVGQILSVRNGFLHNYRRGGYRDVKLFVNLRQHICEIQLHLSSFYDMKDDQHVVYEWSRRLNVTVEMKAENLFQNMGPDILQQMIKLARVDWHSTGGALPFLLAAVGKYGESEQLFRKSYDSLNARMEWKEATFGRNSKEWNLSARFAAMSMNNLASVLASKGKHDEALRFLKNAVLIWEEACGSDTPDVATGLDNLAKCLETQGEYREADLRYLRSIEIVENTLGPAHPSVGVTLSNRAGLLDTLGEYAEAKDLYKKAQKILENSVGQDSLEVAMTLNNRAMWCRNQGNYDEADSLYVQVLKFQEKHLGPDHPALALTLNNQANSWRDQSKLSEATSAYQQAIAIIEKSLGKEHPNLATPLTNLAGLLVEQLKFEEADRTYQRSLVIVENVFGLNHSTVTPTLNGRGQLRELQGKFHDALQLYDNSLAIMEEVFGPEHVSVATYVGNKAGCLMELGNYAEAERLYLKAQKIFENLLHPDHPRVGTILNNRGVLLKRQKRYSEALSRHEASLAIFEKTFDLGHPSVAMALGYQASCLYELGKFTQASLVCSKAQEAFQKAFHSCHPNVGLVLHIWGLSLAEQGKVDEADARYLLAIEIAEKAEDHLVLAKILNNRAFLLRKQGRYDEVVPLLERALRIRKKMLGEHDKYTLESLSALNIVQEEVAERQSRTSWWGTVDCNVS